MACFHRKTKSSITFYLSLPPLIWHIAYVIQYGSQQHEVYFHSRLDVDHRLDDVTAWHTLRLVYKIAFCTVGYSSGRHTLFFKLTTGKNWLNWHIQWHQINGKTPRFWLDRYQLAGWSCHDTQQTSLRAGQVRRRQVIGKFALNFTYLWGRNWRSDTHTHTHTHAHTHTRTHPHTHTCTYIHIYVYQVWRFNIHNSWCDGEVWCRSIEGRPFR
jgi:hypothetical protein